MKTSVASAAPTFSPVVVTITLESEQELKMLRKLVGKSKTVARAVAANDVCSTEDECILAAMLYAVFNVL